MRNLQGLQEQVEKTFCYQKLFWPFTIWINFSSDLKNLEILGLQPRISKVFFRSLEQFFLTVGQNNFGNKIPIQSPEIHLKLNCLSPFICKTRSSFYENKVLHQLRKVSWKYLVFIYEDCTNTILIMNSLEYPPNFFSLLNYDSQLTQ